MRPSVRLFANTITIFSLLACQKSISEKEVAESTFEFSYQIDTPSQVHFLPSELNEISGVEWLPNGLLACVQDEKGKIFLYNPSEKIVVGTYEFADDGDYEGLALADSTLYVLRSDGDLYRVAREGGKKATLKIETPLSIDNDAEGLAYDPTENQLLIACKADAGLKEKHKKHKSVFAYNLQTQKLNKNPRLYLDLEDLARKMVKRKVLEFAPSGIAVHPTTQHFYIIASVGKRLLVLDRNGSFLHQEPLDHKYFHQPEGICFAPDGTLFISNEAKGQQANILVFSPTF